jgi:hypothetical protein
VAGLARGMSPCCMKLEHMNKIFQKILKDSLDLAEFSQILCEYFLTSLPVIVRFEYPHRSAPNTS